MLESQSPSSLDHLQAALARGDIAAVREDLLKLVSLRALSSAGVRDFEASSGSW